MPSRCDLHVHSRFSDRPSEWYLAQIGAPESFTEPADIHRLAKARGMRFVTVTDHDEIRGALEIAHLPDTFLSVEITASFPEDGAQIHLLVWGISEEEHGETQHLRRDLYALRRYLLERGIAHAVAHPLFRVDDRLTLDHVEKLLVLFRRFELVNGQRESREGDVFRAVAEALDQETLARLAERHRLEPPEPDAWVKSYTGGSDDHCGLYVATTWTETPDAETVPQFLSRLAAGEHAPGGETGSSLKLARSFQALAHDYYRQKVLAGSRWRNDPIASLLHRFAAGEIPERLAEGGSFASSLRTLVAFLPNLTAPRPALALAARAARAGRRQGVESALAREEERAIFEAACRLGHRALGRAADAALSALESGRPASAIAALPTLATGVVALSPYLAAFRFEHEHEPLIASAARRFPAAAHLRRRGERIAWATDTLDEINGVTRTIRSVAGLARRRGTPLVVVTSSHPPSLHGDEGFDVERFRPIFERPLPRYEELRLSVPPVVELIEWLEREAVGEVVISTPGPVGLAALAGARLLGLPTTALYHTDFPRYVEALGLGHALVERTRRYVGWFYRQFDRVLVSARSYRSELEAMRIDPERMGEFPHGVDTSRFRPDRRRAAILPRPVAQGRPHLLYVGRLAAEKNLDLLFDCLPLVRERLPDARLTLIGDGPERARLEARAPTGVEFRGYLEGDALADAYAGADLFVFPSRTDTFGNVVLEALASGLPAVVAAEGGPAEQIVDSGAGRVADGSSPAAFAHAILRIAEDPALRAALGRRGREHALGQSWQALLDQLAPSPPAANAFVDEPASEVTVAVSAATAAW